ncbi:MAG: signal peptidase I [Candidatus Uhrbacteria bacterium]|nr:signal peptidase I [Candidatus Uhrbacteria bacterium]
MLFKRRQDIKEPFAYRVFGATLGAVVLFIVEVLQVVIVAAAIIVPVRYFLIKPFIVRGASMEPNYYENDYLIIDEVTYRFKDAQRGEIVVFRPPGNESQFYIKRIIGLPGETVEILDGVITVFNSEYPNGTSLSESYIEDYTEGHERVILGADEYYLLGDNRDSSFDSRKFGPVDEESIVGKVWIRGLPFERISTFTSPDYNF